jgi:hypothetical protein
MHINCWHYAYFASESTSTMQIDQRYYMLTFSIGK